MISNTPTQTSISTFLHHHAIHTREFRCDTRIQCTVMSTSEACSFLQGSSGERSHAELTKEEMLTCDLVRRHSPPTKHSLTRFLLLAVRLPRPRSYPRKIHQRFHAPSWQIIRCQWFAAATASWITDHGLLVDRELSGYCGMENVLFPTTTGTRMFLVVFCCPLASFATVPICSSKCAHTGLIGTFQLCILYINTLTMY